MPLFDPPASGGPGVTVREGLYRDFIEPLTSISFLAPNSSNVTHFMVGVDIGGALNPKSIGVFLSRSTGTTLVQTINAGFYTLNGSTLSLISSTSNSYSLSATSAWSQTARFDITGLSALELSAGQYWMALNFRVTSGQPAVIGRASSVFTAVVGPGANATTAATNIQIGPGLGSFTAPAGSPCPASVALSNIGGQSAGTMRPFTIITEIP